MTKIEQVDFPTIIDNKWQDGEGVILAQQQTSEQHFVDNSLVFRLTYKHKADSDMLTVEIENHATQELSIEFEWYSPDPNDEYSQKTVIVCPKRVALKEAPPTITKEFIGFVRKSITYVWRLKPVLLEKKKPTKKK